MDWAQTLTIIVSLGGLFGYLLLRLEHRMDRLEDRLDRIEERLGALEQRVASIEGWIRHAETR